LESFHFSDYKRDIDWGALRAAPREELLQELRLTRRLYDALDAIIENSKDGFFITDGQGQVIKVNRSYEELAGISREELVGRHMSQLEHTLISESASLVVLKTGKPVTIHHQQSHF